MQFLKYQLYLCVEVLVLDNRLNTLIKNNSFIYVGVLVLGGLVCVALLINFFWVPDLLSYLALIPHDSNAIIISVLVITLLVSFIYLLLKSTSRAAITFGIVSVILITYGSTLLYKIVNSQVQSSITKMVTQSSDLLEEEVQTRLNYRLFALEHLAKSWQDLGVEPNKDVWQHDAEQMMEYFPGFDAIGWVNPDVSIRWSIPEGVSAKKEFQFAKERVTARADAKAHNELTLTPSVDLASGDRGFIAYMPVFVNNIFEGYVVGIVSYKGLFGGLLNNSILPDYAMKVRVAGKTVFTRGTIDQEIYKSWGNQFSVDMQGKKFVFEVAPTSELVGHQGKIVLAAIFFVAALVILLTIMTMTLIIIMQRFAARLAKSNKELVIEMKDRKEAENAREQMKKAMLQGQKLEAIGTLAGGIAHNFNNILYSIKGYAELIREDTEKGSMAFQNIGKVLEGAERGQELVQGIMSFSRQESQNFEQIELKTVIESTLSLMQSTLPASVELFVNIAINHEKIQGNHTQLQQVLMNIISNAADAMDRAGKIRVGVTRQNREEILQQYSMKLMHSNYLVVTVEDNGEGMSEETQQRVFEPFFTTKEVGKGTGLGLATSRSIIQDHDGEILIDSKVGSGTKFSILIPEYKAEEEQHG